MANFALGLRKATLKLRTATSERTDHDDPSRYRRGEGRRSANSQPIRLQRRTVRPALCQKAMRP